MVRIITVPVNLLYNTLESVEVVVDGPVFCSKGEQSRDRRSNMVTRSKRANPSKEELEYLRYLATNQQPVTVEGSRWERK